MIFLLWVLHTWPLISTWSLIFFTFKPLPPKNTFHCLYNNCCWRIPCVFDLIDDGKFSSGYFLLKGDSRPNDLVTQWCFVFCIVHIIIKLCWVRSVLQRYTRNTLFSKYATETNTCVKELNWKIQKTLTVKVMKRYPRLFIMIDLAFKLHKNVN